MHHSRPLAVGQSIDAESRENMEYKRLVIFAIQGLSKSSYVAV